MSLDLLKTLSDKEHGKYREVTATPGTVAVAVVNPDGSSIAGGGGGGGAVTNAGTFPVQLNAYQTATTGAITTNSTTITATDLMGVGGVTVSIYGTHAGINVTFEQSTDNGTTWANATAVSTTTAGAQPFSGATGVLTTNSTNIWNITPLLGVAQFRVRATAYGSGSGTTRIDPSAQFSQPNVASTLWDGTNTANVLSSAGTAAGQNAELVAGSYLSVPFTTTTVQAVGTTDVGNYKSVSVHLVTTGTSAQNTVQGSNDNTNWVNVALSSMSPAGVSSLSASVNTASAIYSGSVAYRYFRINVTGIVGGTTAGVILFSTLPLQPYTIHAQQSTAAAWTVGSNSATGSAVPANAFMGGMSNGTNLFPLRTNVADAESGTTFLGVVGGLYNGTNYDRQRNNEAVTLLASAARTTTQTSADLVNYNGASYLDVILNMTVVGTGSVTLTINGKDPASATYYPILAGLPVITNSQNVYKIGVGRTAAANVIANDTIPRIFQIVVTANNANSATYSVGYNLTRGQ